MDGLRVKDGRLINDRPEPVSGISKAAALRREFKSSRNIRDIAAGIELAEQQKEMRDMMMDSFKSIKKR
tara:strand:+ start:547 stop:753 length:207 start_codon:yes stop_codon:yes gene_type:complete